MRSVNAKVTRKVQEEKRRKLDGSTHKKPTKRKKQSHAIEVHQHRTASGMAHPFSSYTFLSDMLTKHHCTELGLTHILTATYLISYNHILFTPRHTVGLEPPPLCRVMG